MDDWQPISCLLVLQEKEIFVLFDTAYQGFASGDPDKDAFPVRVAVNIGLEFFAAQSFSKNFGLYSKRSVNISMSHICSHVYIIKHTAITSLQYSLNSTHIW